MPLFGKRGERIAYAVHPGPEGAPPLLLLHGFTASSASWVSNLPGLAERFTVITADLLGHGDSDAPDAAGLYSPDAAVARLTGLLDELGLGDSIVCGHSLGGALALRLALDAPERVAALVVLNSNSAAGTPEWREGAREGLEAMAAKARAEGTAFLRETRLYPAKSTRLPGVARALLVRDFERLSPQGFAGTAEALVVDVNSFERLDQLHVPTLVVIGDRDRDFVQSAPRFLVRLPHALVDTFTIEGAGHAANLEQPALFNQALFAFAERVGYLAPGEPEDVPPPAVAGEVDSKGDEDDGPPVGFTAATSNESDEELGPTLYQELGRSLRSGGRQLALAVAGGLLFVSGAALLVGAFVLDVNGDDPRVAAGTEQTIAATATATPTAIERSAGVRTAAPASPTSTQQPTAELTTTVTQQAAAPTAPRATPTRTPTPSPTATSEPTVTPTMTPSPTATSTPTPSGPSVTISGPATGSPGEPLTFVSVESPGAITRSWTSSSGQLAAHTPTFTVTFASAGCHSVTVTAVFETGIRSATRIVAVGVDGCS